MRRCGVAATLVVVAASTMSACASHGPVAGPTTVATTAAPSSTATASASTSTSTTLVSIPTCPTDGMAIGVAGSAGTAAKSSTAELTLSVRNDSQTACHMEGYPTPALIDSTGTSLPTTVVRGASVSFTDFAPDDVVLEPTDSAYFNVAYADVAAGTGTCESAAQIDITMPGSADHQTLPLALTVCNEGTLTVSPVFGATSSETETTAPAAP